MAGTVPAAEAAAGGQSESYGIQTVQDVAGIINRNLAGLYAPFG